MSAGTSLWVRIGRALGWTLLGVALCVLHVRLSPLAYDDAYIHFRIARNFVQLDRPFFNSHELVMGSSSPAWLRMLILLEQAQALQPIGVAIINSFIMLLALMIWSDLACSLAPGARSSRGLFSAAILATAGFLMESSTGLMETPLALVFAGLSIQLFQRERALAGIFVGCACAVRLEAFVLVPVLFALGMRRSVEFGFRLLGAILLGYFPFVLFCVGWYGTIIPGPVWAKHLVYDVRPQDFIQALFAQILGEGALSDRKWIAASYAILLTGGVVAGILLSRERWRMLAEARAAWVLSVSGMAVLVTYAVTRAYLFPWYLPLFTVPLAIGVLAVTWRWRAARIWALACASPALFKILGAVALATSEVAWTADPNARSLQYLKIGQALEMQLPDSVVVAPEIGALGWTFHGRIVDAMGLVSPNVLRFHPVPYPTQRRNGLIGAIPPELVLAIKPDVIVSMEEFARPFDAVPSAARLLLTDYKLAVLPVLPLSPTGELWNSRYIKVWVRSGLNLDMEELTYISPS